MRRRSYARERLRQYGPRPGGPGGVLPSTFVAAPGPYALQLTPPPIHNKGPVPTGVIDSPAGLIVVPPLSADLPIRAESVYVFGWAHASVEVRSTDEIEVNVLTPSGAQIGGSITIAAGGGAKILVIPIIPPYITLRATTGGVGGDRFVSWSIYLREQP